MTDLQTIVLALAGLTSAVYGIFVAGNITAIFDLFGPLLSLRSVSWGSVKNELLALSATDRHALEQKFLGALTIRDEAVLAKLTEGVSVLENLVTAGAEGYGAFQGLVAVWAQIKALLGIASAPAPEGKMRSMPPARLVIPGVPAWLMSIVVTVILNFVLPQLEKMFPNELAIFEEIAALLSNITSRPAMPHDFIHGSN